MRIGFVTCVELGKSCIEEILSMGGRLDVLFTLEDELARKKSGRVYLDELAADHGIDLLKLRHVDDPWVAEEVRRRELDWLFIIGWSQIAGPEILAAPTRGCLGMHPTLLPEGRGRAAIPWAIIKGLDATGVTLFQLDAGVDTGPILDQVRLPLSPDETATTLYQRVADAHRELMRAAWPRLIADELTPQVQDESLASVWPGRKPADGRIDPTMTVAEVDRLVRAVTHPYPGAFWVIGERTVTVWAGRTDGPGGSDDLELVLADGRYWVTDWDDADR